MPSFIPLANTGFLVTEDKFYSLTASQLPYFTLDRIVDKEVEAQEALLCSLTLDDCVVVDGGASVITLVSDFKDAHLKQINQEMFLTNIAKIKDKPGIYLVDVASGIVVCNVNTGEINPHYFTGFDWLFFAKAKYAEKTKTASGALIIQSEGRVWRYGSLSGVFTLAIKQGFDFLSHPSQKPTHEAAAFIYTFLERMGSIISTYTYQPKFVVYGNKLIADSQSLKHIDFSTLDKIVDVVTAPAKETNKEASKPPALPALPPPAPTPTTEDVKADVPPAVILSLVVNKQLDLASFAKYDRLPVVVDNTFPFLIQKVYFEPKTERLIVYTPNKNAKYVAHIIGYNKIAIAWQGYIIERG